MNWLSATTWFVSITAGMTLPLSEFRVLRSCGESWRFKPLNLPPCSCGRKKKLRKIRRATSLGTKKTPFSTKQIAKLLEESVESRLDRSRDSETEIQKGKVANKKEIDPSIVRRFQSEEERSTGRVTK